MIALSKEIAKFLDFFKFWEEDSVVIIKDIKAVIKAPYNDFIDWTQIRNWKIHYIYKRWDDLGEHGM